MQTEFPMQTDWGRAGLRDEMQTSALRLGLAKRTQAQCRYCEDTRGRAVFAGMTTDEAGANCDSWRILKGAADGDSWQILHGAEDGTIWCKFVGPTPTSEMVKFLEALTVSIPEAHAKIAFDLRELDGYNSETKEPVKAWLIKNKLRLSELTVVVPKSRSFLKLVTAAISLAVGVKIRIREDSEDVEQVANMSG